jgi:hypothetical protein
VTRRERLERRAERRLDWAASRERRAAAAQARADGIARFIPPGQPILVGHHSERHHRRDLERIDSAMRTTIESSDMAAHHRSAAAGIERQLDRSVFSDDANAIEVLEARIAEKEAKREKAKRVNALYRKGDAAGLAALGLSLDALRAALADALSWLKQPHPAYEDQA